MFSSVVDVLEIIEEDGLSDQKVEARSSMRSIPSFEFVFALHLMKNILGITNELSIALQKKKKKNQDIVNARDGNPSSTCGYPARPDPNGSYFTLFD